MRRWDEARSGKDLHVIDGLTVTKMANEGGDYATVLGTLFLASGQHSWNVYINHVEDSNLFIGVCGFLLGGMKCYFHLMCAAPRQGQIHL